MIEVFLILYGLLATTVLRNMDILESTLFFYRIHHFLCPQDQFVSIFRLFQIKKKRFMILATVLIIIPKLIRYFLLNLCQWNFSYYFFIIRISFIFGSNAWPEIQFFLPELANLSFQPIFYYLCCRNVFVKVSHSN